MVQRRFELSDAQWEQVRKLLPLREGAGRPGKDDRSFMNAVLWIARTGSPWRDLPERYGNGLRRAEDRGFEPRMGGIPKPH